MPAGPAQPPPRWCRPPARPRRSPPPSGPTPRAPSHPPTPKLDPKTLLRSPQDVPSALGPKHFSSDSLSHQEVSQNLPSPSKGKISNSQRILKVSLQRPRLPSSFSKILLKLYPHLNSTHPRQASPGCARRFCPVTPGCPGPSGGQAAPSRHPLLFPHLPARPPGFPRHVPAASRVLLTSAASARTPASHGLRRSAPGVRRLLRLPGTDNEGRGHLVTSGPGAGPL